MSLARLIAILLVSAGFACFAAAETASRDSMRVYSPVPPAGYWMRLYPLRQYGAHWHLELVVKDLPQARKAALAAMEKFGGEPTIPIESMAEAVRGGAPVQQLSFRLERKNATKAWKRLLKLGRAGRQSQLEDPLPEVREEVPEKLSLLRADRASAGAALEKAAGIAALSDEVLKHLEAAEAAYRQSQDRILLNIVLQEAAR